MKFFKKPFAIVLILSLILGVFNIFLFKPEKVSGNQDEKEISYIDLEWYLEIFGWLSEICQDLPGMEDSSGLPTEKAEGCFDPEKVVQIILEVCRKGGGCTYAKPVDQEPWCYCQEGERPLGWGKTKPYEEYKDTPEKINYCVDFSFNSPERKVRIYTDATPGGGVIYIAKDSCSDPDINDQVANPPSQVICSFETPRTDGTQEYFCDLSNVKGEIHGGVYNNDKDDDRSTSAHSCAPCYLNDIDYPYYGTEYDQCTGKGAGGGHWICGAIGIPPGTPESKKEAATKQCNKLFSEEGESIPSGCNSDPIATLQNKCGDLKNEGRKEVPEPCKILPLFTGEIEKPDSVDYRLPETRLPPQTIGNYPSSILGCPASLPTIPKICPPSITLPDIKLPEFKLEIKLPIIGKIKLLHIKLPSLITEDLNFPCIELCDINECQDIFPDLNFRLPYLSIPTVEIPPIPLGTVEGVKLPDLELDPIPFPHIPFPIFRIPNLGNLVMPELEYSGFTLPGPRLNYSFSDIDLSPIFGYIITFIKNALGIPDFTLCISSERKSPIPIELIYPDYYFSLCQLGDIIKGKAGKVINTLCKLRIPEIPYCQDVNEFCQNMKTKIAEVINKAKEIERVFNELVQREIQLKLDKAALEIQEELTKNIHQRLEEVKTEIRRQAEEQIREGRTRIVIRIDNIEIPSLYLDAITKIPTKIPIPWPEELKKIELTCDEAGYNQCKQSVINECEQKCAGKKTNRCNLAYLKCQLFCQAENYSKKCDKEYLRCLSYDLPTIPLSCLSYEKEFPIKGPGLQSTSFIFEVGRAECLRGSPSGGNPCPETEFESNLEEIKNLKAEIERTSQKIISILE